MDPVEYIFFLLLTETDHQKSLIESYGGESLRGGADGSRCRRGLAVPMEDGGAVRDPDVDGGGVAEAEAATGGAWRRLSLTLAPVWRAMGELRWGREGADWRGGAAQGASGGAARRRRAAANGERGNARVAAMCESGLEEVRAGGEWRRKVRAGGPNRKNAAGVRPRRSGPSVSDRTALIAYVHMCMNVPMCTGYFPHFKSGKM